MTERLQKMYITHQEYKLIKTSYECGHYALSEIIVAHYNMKKDYLLKKKDYLDISVIRYHILCKKADKQFMECFKAMQKLMRTRKEFFNSEFYNFEKEIYNLDMIGIKARNPINSIINYSKRR